MSVLEVADYVGGDLIGEEEATDVGFFGVLINGERSKRAIAAVMDSGSKLPGRGAGVRHTADRRATMARRKQQQRAEQRTAYKTNMFRNDTTTIIYARCADVERTACCVGSPPPIRLTTSNLQYVERVFVIVCC